MPNAHKTLDQLQCGWLADTSLQTVFSAIEAAGFQVRAVGGVVRDTLLADSAERDRFIDVGDIDLATDARPEQAASAAEAAGLKSIPTGASHGTITVIAGGRSFEVTSLRHDLETDGRRATVAFTDDWHADAQRRDFTINAIYCDRHGQVFDPIGGIQDLAERKLRFIGDASQRIREDYLRILRLFRFVGRLEKIRVFDGDLLACTREREGLRTISAERKRAETLKLLSGPSAPTRRRTHARPWCSFGSLPCRPAYRTASPLC